MCAIPVIPVSNDITVIKPGDTVWSTGVLGMKASCEHPPALFCIRGDELEVLEITPPTKYEKKVMYKCRLKRGTGHFWIYRSGFTKTKPFNHNMTGYEFWDGEKIRDYGGY